MKKTLLWIGGILLTPILLFIILSVLLYIPPVQNWAVKNIASYISDHTDMQVSVNHVNLAFPLNLGVDGIKIISPNDSMPQVRDTIADVGRAVVDVELLPLLKSKVVINTLELNKAKINTADFIHEARIKGNVGRMFVSSKGIDLKSYDVLVNGAKIEDTNLNVELSDTVPPDTAKSENFWKIYVDSLNIKNADITVHMPGDTMQVRAYLGKSGVRNGTFNLNKGLYTVQKFILAEGRIRYDNNFKTHVKGLDYNHVDLRDVHITIDSLYYLDPKITLTLASCSFKEQSGINVDGLSGVLFMDSLRIRLPKLKLKTPDSDIYAEMDMALNTFDDNNPGKTYLRLIASLGKQDLMRFGGDLPQAFIRKYPNHPLLVRGAVNGNLKHIDFSGLQISLPTAFSLYSDGYAVNPTAPDRLRAQLSLHAKTYDLGFITGMLPADIMRNYRIPSGISIDGDFGARGKHYHANFIARESKGSVRAKVDVNTAVMQYAANLKITNMNLHHFMPKDSLYTLSAKIDAQGSGTDIFAKNTKLKATATIDNFRYGHWNINDIVAKVNVAEGVGHAVVNSNNYLLDGNIMVDALMSRKKLQATLATDLERADLFHLRLLDTPLTIATCAHVDILTDMLHVYKVEGSVSDITIRNEKKIYRPDDIIMDIMTNRDTTWAKVSSGNLILNMTAKGGYQQLINQGNRFYEEMSSQIKNKVIDQPKLRKMLPILNLYLSSGNNNPVTDFLKPQGIEFDDLYVNMTSSPHTGLNGVGHVYRLVADSTRIDTIKINVVQDSTRLTYNGQIQNNQYNPQFVFNTLFDGYVYERGAGVDVKYYDSNNKLGASLGVQAELQDDGINFHLRPDRPILGYKVFNLNKDNFVYMGSNRKIQAKVNLIADDGTGVQIYSDDQAVDMLQDLTVSLNKFDLEKITAVIPYAPRLSGLLNGDFHVMLDKEDHVAMVSDLSIDKMTYEHCPLGNVSSEFSYLQKDDDSHWVEARLMRNEAEVGILNGTYQNRGDGYLDAVLDLKRLPISMVNGFIPDQLFGLEGYADGQIDIKGSLVAPKVNGEVYLDSSYLVSVPYGMKLRFDNDPIRIVGSNLLLENFNMYAHNANPLTVYGNINFSRTDNIMMSLKMRARNYEVINAEENSKSVAFGRAYVNFYGTMNGALDNLMMRGKLDVLGSTDMSYVLRDTPLTTDNQLNELVKFTDFTDTTNLVVKHPPITGFNMDLTMDISKGAHIMAYLNADHSNYIDLMGGGTLRMQYNIVDNLRLTGRYTLSNGEMLYSLPIIPLKTFTIQNGSYLEFMGDPMNPRLNITAVERTKATVSNNSGIGRSVAFDCGVKITKTLNDMGLEFTLEAPEDMTLHNELETMGREQRGKLAVTMLTTGMYLADGNTKSFSMNSALSSFLNSEINHITGNALRTLDLSFGMDNSTDATGNDHTDYSFKFAKRFWNNRVKITVGGKISTGADAQKQNESFFDNVALEYRLDDTANKYVTLFYENNAYDWLDGYTRMFGGGFIWRRSLNHFRDIFNFKNEADDIPMITDTIKSKSNEK